MFGWNDGKDKEKEQKTILKERKVRREISGGGKEKQGENRREREGER